MVENARGDRVDMPQKRENNNDYNPSRSLWLRIPRLQGGGGKKVSLSA